MLETNRIIHGDCLDVMRTLPDRCVDLIIDSPPYCKARTYGIGFALDGQDWVDWMAERTVECLRVCKGLVATVVEGQTKNFRYNAAPVLLMADLHRRGIHLRKPPVFHRVGIPGSGGPDWLRNDYEYVICCTNGGKLPWSDNTACGHPPRWAPGGAMSNRTQDGKRKNARGYSGNQWGKNGSPRGMGNKNADGTVDGKPRPSHKRLERGNPDGSPASQPVLANPGNTIREKYTADEVAELLAEASDVTHHLVGGGVMGSPLSSLNEAPFPETLAEFFIKSFCPPGGIVLDRFCGSGTTLAVAQRLGRQYIGIDVRESQVELSGRRVG